MKIALLVIAVSSLACASSTDTSTADLQAVAHLGLGRVEGRSEVILVVQDRVPTRIKRLLSSLHPVVGPSQVPQSAEFILPPGYVEVSVFKVSGASAWVSILAGPVPRPAPGRPSFNCGTGYAFAYEKRAGAWVLISTQVESC